MSEAKGITTAKGYIPSGMFNGGKISASVGTDGSTSIPISQAGFYIVALKYEFEGQIISENYTRAVPLYIQSVDVDAAARADVIWNSTDGHIEYINVWYSKETKKITIDITDPTKISIERYKLLCAIKIAE